MFNKKRLIIVSLLFISLLVACGDDSQNEENLVDGDNIDLVYVNWDTEVASTNVIAKVLEGIGYNVSVIPLDNAIMWQSLAEGESDAMVSAWLPQTHASQVEEYGDQIDHLGVNLEGGKIGYVVPTYMDVDSVEDLTTEANQTVTGIEEGSGTVKAAQEVAETYPNLEDWTVETSSSGAMATVLGQAIENEEEVVVTGWTPHWKFQQYDLKFLEEPKNIFGQEETIETYARKGLQDDHPVAYSVLEKFHWGLEDIESVMLAIHEGTTPEEAAQDWVDKNEEKVSEWLSDAQDLSKK